MSEGAAVPETAKQAPSNPTRDRDWIDRAIWTERMLAALGNGVKGRKWFSLIDKVYRPQTLAAAWQQVKANQGAAGIDGQSIERFAAEAERYLRELAEDLKEGRYQAAPVRRVDIPKAGGKTRPLGIPTVKDRIVQTAVKRVIEPIFEQEFLPMSYGFRPGRGCKDALRDVDEWLKKGYTHVVDADLKSYFDSIPHARLKERIEEHISDGRLLEILAGWLRQDIVHGLEKWTPTGGTPQGAVITPCTQKITLSLSGKSPFIGLIHYLICVARSNTFMSNVAIYQSRKDLAFERRLRSARQGSRARGIRSAIGRQIRPVASSSLPLPSGSAGDQEPDASGHCHHSCYGQNSRGCCVTTAGVCPATWPDDRRSGGAGRPEPVAGGASEWVIAVGETTCSTWTTALIACCRQSWHRSMTYWCLIVRTAPA
jgi:retron-type reverse transcriptase